MQIAGQLSDTSSLHALISAAAAPLIGGAISRINAVRIQFKFKSTHRVAVSVERPWEREKILQATNAMLLLDYLLLKRTHRRRNLNSPRKQELHERKRRKVSLSLANMVKDLLSLFIINLLSD